MKITDKYLSQMAKKIEPYEWAQGISDKMLRFDANTMPFPPKSLPVFLKEMADKCLVNEYADPAYKNLKKLIAVYEQIDEEMITITNSGDEALDILAKIFLDPDDYFIVTPPTYECFSIQCEINRGQKIEIPLAGNNFMVNAEEIIKEGKKNNVKLVFLCNPNNPTASIIPDKTIERIVKNFQGIVVVDEAYGEFYGKSSKKQLAKYNNLVILRSFSKFASLAGARIGYLLASRELSKKFDGVRLPMGVGYLSYKLAETVLKNDRSWIIKQISLVKKERSRLTKQLQKLGFYVYPSRANFLLVRIGINASIICQKLMEKNILIRDRSRKKYLDGCVRITVRSQAENTQLLKALKEIIYEI